MVRVLALAACVAAAAAASPSVVELTGLPVSCELRHGGASGIESSCPLHVNGVDVVGRLATLQKELAALELDQSGMEKTAKAQEATLSDHGDELDALEKQSKAFLKTHTDTAAAFNADLELLNSHIQAAQVAAKAAQRDNAEVAAAAHKQSSDNAVAHEANKKAQEDALTAVAESSAKSHAAAELARESNANAVARNILTTKSNDARLKSLESEHTAKEAGHKEATIKYTASGRRLLTAAKAAAINVPPVPTYQKEASHWRHVSSTASSCEITLVTQCSLDRLPALRRQMASWADGKMSVALYVPHGLLARNALDVEADALLQDAERNGVDLTISVLADVDASDGKYPINSLRNLALGQVRTPLVFLIDVDFVVSAGFVQWAKTHHAELLEQCDAKRQALVVPAFEYHASSKTAAPRTMAGLAGEWAAQRVSAFHSASFPEGHGSTNYQQWWKLSSTVRATPAAPATAYGIEFAGHYEPYVIAAVRHVPAYDERLRGYGMNKVAHLQAMHLLRRTAFKVLLDQFVVAHEHGRSAAFNALHSNADNLDELQSVFSKVVEELGRGIEPMVHESTRIMLKQE